MNRNYFQHGHNSPYHLSVGAVLVDDERNVICHYFDHAPEKAPGEYKNLKDVYLLMRETPESGEDIYDTLQRGLMEEFGAKGETLAFLGSQEAQFTGETMTICKTTIYFLVKLTNLDESKRSDEDIERESKIVRVPLDQCIANMQEQWERLHIETLNESSVVMRAKEYLASNNF